jgi:hypothetical protein
MSRARFALLAAVLVVATAATGMAATGGLSAPVQPGDDPTVGVSENSSRVLLLTRADAAGFESADLSVTDALDSGYEGVTTQYRLERLESALENADTDAERRALIQREIDWAADRTTALVERERAARAAYAAGDITAAEYLTTVGSSHAAAESIEAFLGDGNSQLALYPFADTRNYGELTTQISQNRARIQTLIGPVRDRAAAVVQGDREQAQVHVTIGDGVMLSTIEGDRYVRETVRPGNLDEATASYDPVQYVSRTYPWTVNNSRAASYSLLGQYAVQFSTSHSHGDLEIYYDVSTERVFVERQQLRLSETPVTYESSTSANNTTLLVSRTYTGGPVNVRVENATGGGIDAPVTLDGADLGSTGADGELWATSPGGEYEVSVAVDGETLNATVVANPQPPVEDATANEADDAGDASA